MSDEIKEEAQEQAEQAYGLFLKFIKLFSFGSVAIILLVASCNFGVDGTGGGYDPSQDLKDAYLSNMGLD